MHKKQTKWSLLMLLLAAVVMVACQPQTVEVTRVVTEEVSVEVPVEIEVEVTRVVTETVTETVTEVVTETVEVEVMTDVAPLGSDDNPIKVLFVPSVDADVIVSGGELLAEQLKEATGYTFEVSVPTSYAATIEAMCASPADTIGFIPALGYVLANERCGVQVGNAAVRNGLPWYAAQFIVRSDSGIESLEDLAGKTWAVPSVTSTSGFLFPSAMLSDLGVEPGEIVEAGGHTQAILAVYNGDVDFATSFFSPPLLPAELGRTWTYGVDDPELWRAASGSPERVDGRVFIGGTPDEGGYRILDARAGAMETAPDIFDTTTILALTDQIPNDTVSFGSQFPLGQAQEIIAALSAYIGSDACLNPAEGVVTLCSDDFYGWTGAAPVSDSFFDPVRFLISALGYTEEDILGE